MEHYGAAAYIGTRVHPGGLPLVLAAAAACAALEVWLARREKRWPGLVLPGAAFLRALVLAALTFADLRGRYAGAAGFALLTLLQETIPALVLLAVCAVCRCRRRRKLRRERAKMDINDIWGGL